MTASFLKYLAFCFDKNILNFFSEVYDSLEFDLDSFFKENHGKISCRFFNVVSFIWL